MRLVLSEQKIRLIFVISLILKALNAATEIVGGIVIFLSAGSCC